MSETWAADRVAWTSVSKTRSAEVGFASSAAASSFCASFRAACASSSVLAKASGASASPTFASAVSTFVSAVPAAVLAAPAGSFSKLCWTFIRPFRVAATASRASARCSAVVPAASAFWARASDS